MEANSQNATPIEPAPTRRKKAVGRPKKCTDQETRHQILEATIRLIRKHGAKAVTVRKVVEEAGVSIGTFYYHFHDKDDLMMEFVREESFDICRLKTPLSDLAGRQSELYMVLVGKYMAFGKDFMKNFYTAWNTALASYMGEVDGAFEADTVMARSEKELEKAKEKGYLEKNTDIHQLAMDICTIVKGCVFEWCLSDGKMDVETSLKRILGNLLNSSAIPTF